MLRWSLVYLLVIMVLVAGAAAGWMLLSSHEAAREIAALETSMQQQKVAIIESRAKLRQARSSARNSQSKLRRSLADLELERTTRGDIEARLIQLKAVGEALKARLAIAERDLAEAVQANSDNARQPPRASASAAAAATGTVTAQPSTATGRTVGGRTERGQTERGRAPFPKQITPTGSAQGFLSDLAFAAKGLADSASQSEPPAPVAVTANSAPAPNLASAKKTQKPATPTAASFNKPATTKIKTEQRVITARLNVRAAPKVTAKLVTTLAPGRKITVSRAGAPDGWHKLVGPTGLAGFIKTTALMANSS